MGLSRTKVSSLARRQRRFAVVTVVPALVVLAAVLGFPIVTSLWLSLQDVQFVYGGIQAKFVELSNFAAVLQDPTFRAALFNTFYFAGLEVPIVLVLALSFSIILNSPGRLASFGRIALLIPWAIAPVANAVLWKWILNSNFGVLNAALTWLQIIQGYVVWLGTPARALNVMLVVDIWKSVPFITLLFIAGLQKIPSLLYRAAYIDGAGQFQQFWHITVPSLRPTVAIAILLQTVWSLRLFDLVYVLTRGGPADGTVMLNFLTYRETFNNLRVGYGAAVADLLFAITLMLSIGYIRLLRSGTPK